MPLKIGFVLRHRYRIESVLGQGGMGAVYKAIDINLGVPVAVKENLFTTEEFARQFRREATILASLRHPNLPRVTDHFVVEGEGQYLVMDFIQGKDLRQRLEGEGPVSEQEALPWFLEISDALAYLHTRQPPILHRDIKPGNIKITPEGRAILVDFGLAKVVDADGATTTGAKAMTPGFSPPEQYGAGRTDPRTDVYSLSATLYTALTATIPEDSLERAMGRESLTPVRKRNPRVSPALARAIEKSLEVRPEDRYQSVVEFAAALAGVGSASRPTLVSSYPYLEPTQVTSGKTLGRKTLAGKTLPLDWSPPSRRPRWPVALVALVTVALITAGAAYAVPDFGRRLAGFFSPASSSMPSTRLPASPAASASPGAATSPGAVASPTAGLTPTLPVAATQPAGGGPTPTGGGIGQLAFASDRTGIPQIFRVNLDGTGLIQLTNMQDGACQPAWSPDGSELVFTSPCRSEQDRYEGSNLWLIGADGTGLEPLPTAPGGDYDPAWSPDGQHIAFTSLRGSLAYPHLYIMALDGSGLKNLSPEAASNTQPSWAPTSRQMVFTAYRSGASEIWLLPDLAGTAQRFSRGPSTDDSHPDWSHDGKLVLFERSIGGIHRLVAVRFEDIGGLAFRICPEGPRASQPMAGPRWSPDDRWIAFETWPTGENHDIAVISANCTNYTVLTNSPAYDFDPAWRP